MKGRSWLEIDLSALTENYLKIKNRLFFGQRILAVVKADAYGLGSVKIAKTLQNLGCRDFGVACIEEGVKLRRAKIEGNIQILGYTPVNRTFDLLKYDLCQSVFSQEYADELIKEGKKIKACVKIDTGMNRLGVSVKDIDGCLKLIKTAGENFDLQGVYTHLCVADEIDKDFFTLTQINAFKRLIDRLFDKKIDIHYANTSGLIGFNRDFANLVRVGIGLYGVAPCKGEIFKPIIKWKAVVSAVKQISMGEYVGYGLSFMAKEDMKIATVCVGYADGYDRRLSNLGKIEINGKLFPVVGKVSMDRITVDVSGSDIKMGDVATVIGNRYTTSDMARDIGTIEYEILCKISPRVKRIFKKGLTNG